MASQQELIPSAEVASRPMSRLNGSTQTGAVKCRPAICRDELEAAYKRVYERYHQKGYIDGNRSGLHVSLYNVLPSTVTFVGLEGTEVSATMSLVADSEFGLPMDQVYRAQTDRLRREGRRLVEAIRFANHTLDSHIRPSSVLLLLMKRVYDYALHVLDADDICIAVHPRHRPFYERSLLFRSFGPVREYPSVNGNESVAMRVDLNTIRERSRHRTDLQEHFFRSRTPLPELLKHYVMGPADLHYFFLQRSNLFKNLTGPQLARLQELYPHCPWEEWV